MEAIIKFKLPMENTEFAIHCMANDMANLLWELTYNLKKKCEREFDQLGEREHNAYDGIDLVFDKINALLVEHNINLDKLEH